MRSKLLFILLFVGGVCHSQKEDFNWFIGRHSTRNDVVYPVGINLFNFNHDPVLIQDIDSIKLTFNYTCTGISSREGTHRYVSNGMHILGEDFKPIVNGDTINYNGKYFELWVSNYGDGSIRFEGLNKSQGMIMLPWPGFDSVFFATFNRIYIDGTFNTDYTKGLLTGAIDTKRNYVVYKDSLVTTDSLSDNSLQACRHANGRDWWLITFSHNHDFAYVFLLDPSGCKLKHKISTPMNYFFGAGQGRFSPNGDRYVLYETSAVWSMIVNSGHLCIFDFDRCSGMISNPIVKRFQAMSTDLGCAFSYDGRFLYTANVDNLYQYDMNANDILGSEKIVAFSDKYKSVYNPPYSIVNDFGYMALAPDGKIYGPGGNTLHMHRIDYPDEEGMEAQVKQHIVNTVNNANTIPNFPHYRLGPEDGSDCDTLGLNNYAVAKFRYEVDTADYLRVRFTDLSYFRPEAWHWDFGDGSTFEGRKPYWHTFPKSGTYEVCLTVSNENGSDTLCRTLILGTSTTGDVQAKENLVDIFPNPSDGRFLLTIRDYVPEQGVLRIYDALGREVHHQRVYYGWNDVEAGHLAVGTYVYKVEDQGKLMGQGKMLVVE
ncbi:MAG TPA: PKD domain-containing protein [Saprospiraceae bacterium]|nr:PKD domain-containing protein [Saprospiraceae bacterium]